jgi:predicted dehydrogenase
MKKNVRLGIIGMGNIGRFHAGYVLDGRVSRCELTAIGSRNPAARHEFKTVEVFDEPTRLIQSGMVDAVLIATPHWQHPQIGMTAFEAGVHVMSEKPIAAHKADAERFLAAHARHRECVFAAMFQFRAELHYHKMRELIQDGKLGQIVRVIWINTDWFRPDAYYASSAWRATWRGEGGGVLINQCLHNLDMLQWLVGMPARVNGFCKFGRFHDIEVEDDVTAYLEWANGATGTFVGSTGEAPGTNRLEIAGTLGRLLLENGRLTFTRTGSDVAEFCRTVGNPFEGLPVQTSEIEVTKVAGPHAKLLQNFVNAILDGERLFAPGAEGIHSLELANAIVLSSLRGSALELPLDGAAWEEKLNELIADSAPRQRVVQNVPGDVARSFKR